MAEKKRRISWKQETVEKTFLEACINEIVVNGREGGSLKPNSWKNIVEKLKTEHDFIVEQRQMKNRYDYLKGKYGAWKKLKNNTGNVYDPVSNKFNLSEKEWQLEMKANKFVEPLRNAPLLFPDLCVQLFDGAASTGFESWGPSSRLPHPSEGTVDPDLNENDDMHHASTENSASTEQLTSTDESSDHSLARDRSQTRSTKRKSKETINSMIFEVGAEITKIARSLSDKHKSDDMVACMEKLDKIGWETEDPRYNTAVLLFGEGSDLRKVWLCLKPESCEIWVKNAGSKYGLL